jgi:hypothetical protein
MKMKCHNRHSLTIEAIVHSESRPLLLWRSHYRNEQAGGFLENDDDGDDKVCKW